MDPARPARHQAPLATERGYQAHMLACPMADMVLASPARRDCSPLVPGRDHWPHIQASLAAGRDSPSDTRTDQPSDRPHSLALPADIARSSARLACPAVGAVDTGHPADIQPRQGICPVWHLFWFLAGRVALAHPKTAPAVGKAGRAGPAGLAETFPASALRHTSGTSGHSSARHNSSTGSS